MMVSRQPVDNADHALVGRGTFSACGKALPLPALSQQEPTRIRAPGIPTAGSLARLRLIDLKECCIACT